MWESPLCVHAAVFCIVMIDFIGNRLHATYVQVCFIGRFILNLLPSNYAIVTSWATDRRSFPQ